MIITIYQKDQGAHKTSWKEFAKYDEKDFYEVSFSNGFLYVSSKTPKSLILEDGQTIDLMERESIFVGGGENFYYTRTEK